MPGSKEDWTLPPARGHEDNSYELAPADPDHNPLLSFTEDGENISNDAPRTNLSGRLSVLHIGFNGSPRRWPRCSLQPLQPTIPPYRNFTRFKLVDLSTAHPGLVDAKITHFADLLCLAEDGCDRARIVQEFGIEGAGAPQENAYGYKYLLDVDGMTYSGRFLGILRSWGLVFKATVFEEYFNGWIRPYEHYVPVLPDLSDLLQKVEWARAHDAEARMIQGRAVAERVMTDAQNDCYFFALLLEWARLQEMARNASVSLG
ncbi:glycosyl transferase family 90-domain-containing protein [Mycena metata]|uniref:Glycosyl transferase family 90-domain-containing protein n=1 Tax=Mycena metata TaxID=1033252 RepID=A0AAD7DV76_9AGAR|nr:glycosyl transferase family 90-domain-containing protein [Mycena metata]